MDISPVTALLPILKGAFYYLPNRNFLPFNGKPMYQHMIAKLLSVPLIEKIVINTDSEEIKAFCKNNSKLIVIDRPTEFIDENIKTDLITAYNLEKVNGEHFIEIQSFNPILSAYSIEAAIKQYFEYIDQDYFDSVFSMQRHELRSYDLDKRELNDDYQFVIFENRIINVFNRTTFRRQGNKKVGKIAMMFEVREVENILVDSDANYELAKLVNEHKEKFSTIFHTGS